MVQGLIATFKAIWLLFYERAFGYETVDSQQGAYRKWDSCFIENDPKNRKLQ